MLSGHNLHILLHLCQVTHQSWNLHQYCYNGVEGAGENQSMFLSNFLPAHKLKPLCFCLLIITTIQDLPC